MLHHTMKFLLVSTNYAITVLHMYTIYHVWQQQTLHTNKSL